MLSELIWKNNRADRVQVKVWMGKEARNGDISKSYLISFLETKTKDKQPNKKDR